MNLLLCFMNYIFSHFTKKNYIVNIIFVKNLAVSLIKNNNYNLIKTTNLHCTTFVSTIFGLPITQIQWCCAQYTVFITSTPPKQS